MLNSILMTKVKDVKNQSVLNVTPNVKNVKNLPLTVPNVPEEDRNQTVPVHPEKLT